VVLAVVGALAGGVAVGVPLGLLTRGSLPSPTPSSTGSTVARARALYQRAVASTLGSVGFHYVAVSSGGTGTERIVGDAGQSGGDQVITFGSTDGSEQFTLVLVSGTVYFQGNVPALEDQLGVPAASAPAEQGKWISVSSGDGPYTVIEPGITIADQVQETVLVPTSTTQVTTAGGAVASRIFGTVPAQPQQRLPSGTGHLDVDASSHLPISYVSTVTGTTTFSGWGAAPAPPGAVAWSTLGAFTPPGGYGSGEGSATPLPTAPA
jgi:hypothetical protein